MKPGIKKFSLIVLAASFPLWVLLAFYIWLDPFKVLRPNYPFFKPNTPIYVGTNKSFISVEDYNHNYKNRHYNSFIFGPSLSIGYRAKSWGKYLPADASIFHFDASAETFDGILMKMDYIISKGETIKNALVILDPWIFERINEEYTHLYIQHPDITPQPDYIQFQWTFFKVFLNQQFLSSYIDLKINGFKPYMKEHAVFSDQIINYDPLTNEETNINYDSMLNHDTENYYKMRAEEFVRTYNKTKELAPYFDKDIVAKLKRMNEIFHSQNTSFKIILPPFYTLATLAPKDKAILYSIFGRQNICDLSGANALSLDYHSFYDGNSHPRPSTCDKVLRIAYSKP